MRKTKTKIKILIMLSLLLIPKVHGQENHSSRSVSSVINAGYVSCNDDCRSLFTGPNVEITNGIVREVTAYNVGDPYQTDNTPCISANGENICAALELGYKRCAANFVPFGTILRIQNYGECMVTDRMNSRYKNRVDIAFPLSKRREALNFGIQKLLVEIVK